MFFGSADFFNVVASLSFSAYDLCSLSADKKEWKAEKWSVESIKIEIGFVLGVRGIQ